MWGVHVTMARGAPENTTVRPASRPKVKAQDGSPYGVRTTWRWVMARPGSDDKLLPPMIAIRCSGKKLS